MSVLDQIDDVGKTSEAITFAQGVARHFLNNTLSIHSLENVTPGTSKIVSSGVATVRGRLNLSHQNIETKIIGNCSFCFLPNWRRSAPALRCNASWVRRPKDLKLRADWHINADESLCYVLDTEWEDCLADIEAKHGVGLTIESAAFYCVNSARWLLYRHLEGYRRKLIGWPREWPYWPHYLAGLAEYAARKRRHQHLPK
jgi:hypothetical protein